MSFELNNDNLQNIAARCTAKFLNKEASLSEAIAKEAMDLEMNPDQIKRAIEATNTVAYLKQLETAEDRTFEFPVADYKEVVASMVLPERTVVVAVNPDTDPLTVDNEIIKNENAAKPFLRGATDFEKVATLNTLILRSVEELKGIEERKSVNLSILQEKKDCLSEEAWKEGLVKEASDISTLIKESKEILAREKAIREALEKAAEEMEKFAIAGLVARGTGALVGGLARSATRSVGNTVSNVGRFQSSAAKKGMNRQQAVKTYDSIAKSKGHEAAKAHFGGAKPSVIHRKGINKIVDTTAAAGTGLTATHQTGVWDTLQKN